MATPDLELNVRRVALIGLGEVGTILATDLKANYPELAIVAFDLLHDKPAMQQKAQDLSIRLATSLSQAVEESQLIFSAVTAAQALSVAEQAATLIGRGQTFLDLNSVSPNTKRQAAEFISRHGGEYVDVAVMAPFPPARLKTPLLLGGKQAQATRLWLNARGFNSQVHSTEVGEASAIKMCRSVMIKGLEALTTECLSAARQYGVEKEVLASLHASFPSLGWDDKLPHYLISRVAEHGKRRAEEMREVVKTLEDVGVVPHQSKATVETQQGFIDALTAHSLSYRDLVPFDWEKTVDRLYKSH
ncbi:NAD(P)-dependent oxidoreductase [Rouxiella badensis]|uniref:NAD(P)-dependent oxidoreductase n=1 Tax=Rouxiella badensis TaxID=1646377 RepID=UPI0013EF15DD|nr:DUF1932 domain-containing protein [Rouxiella badensis]QII38327.1 NAD(P)-dependent oxidoreductase [Rouxiella badensis]